MIKRISALAVSAAIVFGSTLPTFADNQAVNHITGALSTNYNEITNKAKVDVTNVNDLSVTNDVNTSANTGGNSCSYGTLGCTIGTGNATNVTKVSTAGNINTVSITSGPAGNGTVAVNDTTGYLSDQRNKVNNETDIATKNDNTAVINNHVVATSTTGSNRGDYNTGPAMIQSGNAMTDVDVVNGKFDSHGNLLFGVNDNAVEIMSWPGGVGGAVVDNKITGALSTDYNDVTNKTKAKVTNVNDASILNDVVVASTTGYNSGSYGTTGTRIGTGNATTTTGLYTGANINTVAVAMALGSFTQKEESSITGYLSDNRNKIENSDDIVVTTRNNKCSSEDCPDYKGVKWGVVNRDNDLADTGSNLADYGTGPAMIESGVGNILKLVDVWMNTTFTKIK